MQTYRRPAVRAALAELMLTALDGLAERDGTPTIGPMPDLRHWRRYSQSSFVALRRAAWHMPERVLTVGWLDTFSQMADVEPIVLVTRAFRFDETVFDTHYDRLEAVLLADEIRLVEFLPLNGFISSFEQVDLADGLVLRPMTDRQMSAAILRQGVPGEFVGTNAVEISWLNQWALVTERAFPVVSYKHGMPDQPVAPLFPSLDEAASRLVRALRMVCGGSVIATRPIRAQHDDDFPAGLGESAALPAIGVADLNRPTRLLGNEEVDAVREVYRLLGDPAVQGDRALQTRATHLVLTEVARSQPHQSEPLRGQENPTC